MKPTITCTKCGKSGDTIFFEHVCSDGEKHGGIHMNFRNITGETDVENKKLRELLKEVWMYGGGAISELISEKDYNDLEERVEQVLGEE